VEHSADQILSEAVLTLKATYAGLPTPEDMQVMIEDSRQAEVRGYYDPLEDERLREAYTHYLAMRFSIWDMIGSLRPDRGRRVKLDQMMSERALRAFGVAFCGAELIVGTGEYLIGLARERDIVWKKLDEAEARYRLPRKSFTRVYRQLTSFFRMYGYYKARDYFLAHMEAVLAALDHPQTRDVIPILQQLGLSRVEPGAHFDRYKSFVRFSLRRRRMSGLQKVLFSVFEMMGSDIAELKIPLVKMPEQGKRVTKDTITMLRPLLRPGDVFITRHDDAMSNLFLPGFWPHGALYIGSEAERVDLGVKYVEDGIRTSADPVNMLEAKKDGVLLRELEETLHLDAFVVLRPRLADKDRAKALTNALSHAGKAYDFVFDFSTSDRLVCTEVVYRGYHGVGDISFDLSTKAGRKCLSAEDFLSQAIGRNWFDVVCIYGVNGDAFEEGQPALGTLRESFAAGF